MIIITEENFNFYTLIYKTMYILLYFIFLFIGIINAILYPVATITMISVIAGLYFVCSSLKEEKEAKKTFKYWAKKAQK
ncbi:MAG: hypothetical protein PHS54_04110 [Clostridia bacterium]|nr:hypothetical protein [Clostridia bacterium]